MNMQRGLFRLWVVFSVPWIVAIAVAYWVLPEPSFFFSNSDITKVPDIELIRAAETVSWRRWGFVALGIGPPITLLSLGCALLWAARGFAIGKPN